MNKYFKEIDIDNLDIIITKTRQFIYDQKVLDNKVIGLNVLNFEKYREVCPELIESFKKLGLQVIAVVAGITYNEYDLAVHMDYKTPKRNLCRVNIPILNCEGSRTEFYAGGEYRPVYKYASNIVNRDAPDKPVEVDTPVLSLVKDTGGRKVAEFEMRKATVINVQEPHTVYTNPERVPRIVLTVQTIEDPVFLLDDQNSLTENRD